MIDRVDYRNFEPKRRPIDRPLFIGTVVAMSVTSIIVGWILSFWIDSPTSYAISTTIPGLWVGYALGNPGERFAWVGTQRYIHTAGYGKATVLGAMFGALAYLVMIVMSRVIPVVLAIGGTSCLLAYALERFAGGRDWARDRGYDRR